MFDSALFDSIDRAVQQKDVTRLISLLSQRPSPETLNHNSKVNRDRAPLHEAAIVGHLEMARLLIDAGANVNVVKNDCWTPLHLTAFNNHFDVTKLLIESGADVEALNSDGNTPKQLATDRKNFSIVSLLNEAEIARRHDAERQREKAAQLATVDQHELQQLRENNATLSSRVADLEKTVAATTAELAAAKSSGTLAEAELQKRLDIAREERDEYIHMNVELRRKIQALQNHSVPVATESPQLVDDKTSSAEAEARLMQTIRELEARVIQLQAVVDQPNFIPYGLRNW